MASERAADAPSLSTHPAAARALHALLERLDHGELTFTAPDGTRHVYRGHHAGPQADLEIADWGVAGAALRAAEVGLAECYRDGRCETSDLTALLMLCAANESALGQRFYAQPLVSVLLRLKHLLRTNTRAQARRNIAAHYDLSNDFYQLWLDPGMSYSAAVFDGEPGRTLEAAQTAKYQRMIEFIDPRPGQHVLEIGCGWGGFAEYAAQHHGLRVTGITLSPAQLAFARARIARAGLASQVRLELLDYRDLRGSYHHVVSIEMFEAVGERYWQRYFATLAARLAPRGRAALQAITIAPEVFPRYRANSDFIREFIFPGGMLAPEQRMVEDAVRAGLDCNVRHRFGHDYATTLVLWRTRVQAAASAIRTLGFDERFLRLWQFYLCYCEAGFRCGRTDVAQLGLCHAG